MKKSLIPFLAFLAFASFSCKKVNGKKVIEIEVVSLETAKKHVKKFYKTYPDSVGCDSKGKNCKYAVSDYYTVYAVRFVGSKSSIPLLEKFYPEYNFEKILENFPEESDGIRIYEAITDSTVKINYLTYTESSKDPNHKPSNDMLDTVYVIKNGKFDLRVFSSIREKRGPYTKTFHLSCAPDCPDVSLLNP